MIKGFLIKKLGMTQKFRENGQSVPATVCQAAPCFVVGLRDKKKDGYLAVQLAAGKKKRSNKALSGLLKKAKLDFIPEIIREVALDSKDNLPKIGDQIGIETIISDGAIVNVVGITKGRGFAGAVKRWGFSTQPATHGQRDRQRAPGSIGAQTPGRVIKGKKMPGHYGNVKKTVKNLQVLLVNPKKKEILIKGAVPGHKNNWLLLLVKGKNKDFSPLIGKKKENGSKEK